MGFLFLSLTMLGGMLALTLGAVFFFIRFVFSIVFLPFKLVFGLRHCHAKAPFAPTIAIMAGFNIFRRKRNTGPTSLP